MTDFSNEQVKFGNGFDHNWVLKTKGDINQVAAKLTSPTTGISLEVYTDEPGIQVYTGNFLDGTVKGKKGMHTRNVHLYVWKHSTILTVPTNPNGLLLFWLRDKLTTATVSSSLQ